MRNLFKCLALVVLVWSGIQPVIAQNSVSEAGFQPFDEAEESFEEPRLIAKKQPIIKDGKSNRGYEHEEFQENLSPRIKVPAHPERQMMITARAIYRAQQRVSRIESRKRQGHSRLRPTVWGGQQHLINLNAFNSYNSYLDAPWLGGVYSYR